MKMKLLAPLRWMKTIDWLGVLTRIAKAVAPALRKLGEVLVISGAALLGLKGADATLGGLASFDIASVDLWWALGVLFSGLLVWTLANLLDGGGCDKGSSKTKDPK